MKRALAAALLVALAFVIRAQTGPSLPQVVRVSATEPPTTAVLRGRDVYARYGCAMCHGEDGKGRFPNPNAETDGKVPGVIYVAEGYTENELRNKILDGAPVGKADPRGPTPPYRMPGWRGQMTRAEVDDLVRYLQSLYPKSAEEKWR